MLLTIAEKYAAQIVEWLEPFCLHVGIVGSIRRQKPICADVDLVCIPRTEDVKDLFGTVTRQENLLLRELKRYVRASAGKAVWKNRVEPADGGQNLLIELPKCQLDVWCATPATLATRTLCRTGSAQHNIWLAFRASERGGHWYPYQGLRMGGKLVPAETEEDIYHALGLPYIEPANREVAWLKQQFG